MIDGPKGYQPKTLSMKFRVSGTLFDFLSTFHILPWQKTLESLRVIKGLLMRIQLIMLDRVTKELSIAGYLCAKRIIQLCRKSGYLFTSLYLKQCSECLMIYRGSITSCDKSNLSVPVSLNGSGIPTIIPAFHRAMIARRDKKSDMLIQFYLSVFSINRLIPCTKRLSKDVFRSITDECRDRKSVSEMMRDLFKSFMRLTNRYIPHVVNIPLHQGIRFVPTWKALPNSPYVSRRGDGMKNRISSSFLTFPYELNSWLTLLDSASSFQGNLANQGLLWSARVRYPLEVGREVQSVRDANEFETTIRQKLMEFKIPDAPFCGGRLCYAYPGAGKRRVFAIGNYVNQRLLYPVHEWLMNVLRTLPMDGTFNQTKPLERLRGSKVTFSYDLKAATDRWPLRFLDATMIFFFGKSFSHSAVLSTLGDNSFDVPHIEGTDKIAFNAGQPLGYYGSWAVFALSHHFLVWLAADTVYPNKKFTNYAILGDDIVIADENVAATYASFVERLGVTISHQKSLVSDTGCIEFANKFLVDELNKDLSPISLKQLTNYFHPLGTYAISYKYCIKRFSTFCRIGGIGYRGLSSISNPMAILLGRKDGNCMILKL